MYIREVHIENIRSISKFDMKFREGEEAGWHVLIGDNGSGKTTILRSVALGLIGDIQGMALRNNWKDWVAEGIAPQETLIRLEVNLNGFDKDVNYPTEYLQDNYYIRLEIYSDYLERYFLADHSLLNERDESEISADLLRSKWFSCGFGPFRRFSGGTTEWDDVFKNASFLKLAAHLSLFGEDIALSEITNWLQRLQFQKLENKPEGEIIKYIKVFINSDGFLPHETKLTEVSSDGIFFTDGNGAKTSVNQLSDGYRSILSLTFELLRQMILLYGSDKVFENIRKGEMNIPLPGVVLIDEIDAHLHPTWQIRIGQWFTKYFPNLQFIVTTHSPLVCRACEKGTIWRLAAPGTNQESKEITGVDRDKLIYGNVLDAYGTKAFGKDVSISEDANDKLNRLGELNIKSIMGEPMTPEEEAEYYELKSIFPTQKTK